MANFLGMSFRVFRGNYLQEGGGKTKLGEKQGKCMEEGRLLQAAAAREGGNKKGFSVIVLRENGHSDCAELCEQRSELFKKGGGPVHLPRPCPRRGRLS